MESDLAQDNAVITKASIDASNTGRVPIITYHSIDSSGSIVSTSPDLFRRQIAALKDAGYRSQTLGEFARDAAAGKWPSSKTVVLTFDDGFENFLTEAAPVLEEHSFSATVFLVTSKCGDFNDWSGNPTDLPRSRLLSWGQIKELSERGVEFGSHTMTHPELTSIASGAIVEEVERSKTIIEDAVGKPVASFAYPFGRFTKPIQRRVAETYEAACSTDLGRVGRGSDMHALKRIDAYYLSNPTSFSRLESRVMDGYLSLRQLLRTVRSGVMRNYAGSAQPERSS